MCIELFKENGEEDLIAIVQEMNWNCEFLKKDVKSIRALVQCPDEQRVLFERIDNALPKGWYCKEMRTVSNQTYEVRVTYQKESPIGYLF